MDAVRIASIMDDESLKALSAHGVGVGKLSDRLAVHTPADAEKGFTDDFSVDGCVIALKDLTYTVRGGEITLLDHVTGCLEAGAMTALMGPSGAGKTTLLDIMAGRKTAGTVSGKVTFGGRPAALPFLRRFTAYVEQRESLIGSLSVEEHLMYQAELKRPQEETRLSKALAVEELLIALGLAACRAVKVACISGGQAKRVNIGLAMVLNPRVLFIDEPTSGLDTFTANETMAYIKLLAAESVTIISTIHSPSPHTFDLFDNLLLLAGGRVAYLGPRCDAMAFALATWPLQPPSDDARRASSSSSASPQGFIDPAEWLITALTRADRAGASGALAGAYAASQLAADNALAALGNGGGGTLAPLPKHLESELAVSRATFVPALHALRTLVRFRVRTNYSDARYLAPRLFAPAGTAAVVLALYWGVGAKKGAFDAHAGFLCEWAVLPAFGAVGYVAPVIMERGLYLRELADGLFSPTTYLTFKLIDELTLATLTSLPIAAAVFFAISLEGSFALFWMVYVVQIWLAVAMAYAAATSFAGIDTACIMLPAFVIICLFLAGFIITFSVIPDFLRWFTYVNPVRYIWASLMLNQFQGANGDPLWQGGQTVLQHYSLTGFNTDGVAYTWYTVTMNKWACLGFTWLITFFFMLVAWYQLKYKTHVFR